MSDEQENMEVDFQEGKENTRKLTRGEKSKIAAKGRRDKEHVAMLELMKELPVEEEVLNKMDKAAIIKLAICYIKIKHFIQKDLALYGQKALQNGSTQTPNNAQTVAVKTGNLSEGQLMLEALNGFLIFVNKKGTIRFVSRSVQDHLGHKQEYMLGKNVMEYVHESDQHELTKQFSGDKKTEKTEKSSMLTFEEEPQRVFYVRMRFNLPKPGSKTKHSGFMLVQWTGKMKRHISTKMGTVSTDGLLCICRPMQTTPLLEIRMDGNMFMSRHDLGMTFTFCDTRIITLLGYEPSEVVGKTAYHFHNPIDAPKVGDCHHNLIIKGTSVSKYYRFLGKNDNWVWLQTRATIIYNTANKPQYIVCMNYVISEEEGERYLMLEEHQQANRLSERTVLMLPDNHHSVDSYKYIQCSTCTSPKIVELEEENLEKTACLNGELDSPDRHVQSATVSSTSSDLRVNGLLPDTMVNATGFPSQDVGAVLPSLTENGGAQTGLLTASETDYLVSQAGLLLTQCPSTDVAAKQSTDVLLDNNLAVSDAHVPDYLSTCSPASSAGTYMGSPCMPMGASQYNGGMGEQNLGASCSSSHSEDGGYESATSPYNGGYFSPQMVSPVCNYDGGSDRGYTPDLTNTQGLIQGQNCSFGVGYGASDTITQSSNVIQGESTMDIIPDPNSEFANPVLDEILQSFNQPTSDNLDVNMAAVYSTIENLTSQTQTSVSTNVESPSVSGYSKTGGKAPARQMPYPAGKQVERKTDKPLLRSFLTMPKEAIPKQPPGGFLMCNNGKVGMKRAKSVTSVGCINKQGNDSAQRVSDLNPACKNGNTTKPTGSQSSSDSKCSQVEEMDSSCGDSLDFSNFPDEIQEFALQYLVNDFSDAQAQALIADLQSEGTLPNDSFMDTSDSDLTKDFLNTLENPGGNFSINENQTNSNIPFSQSRTTCYPYNSSTKCAYPGQNVNSVLNGTSSQSSSFYSGVTAQDHVYHQSRFNGQNRQRCQKLPEHRSIFNSSNGSQQPLTCHSQTQTSEHCMSELERHLRNRLSSQASNCGDGQSSFCGNCDKPFLQQLLTGELTNDMYMKMERKRFEDVIPLPK